MAKIHIIAKDMGINKFPNIFLLVITRESLILELAPDLCHFLVDDLLFLVFGLAVSDITNEEGETPHNTLLIRVHLYALLSNYKFKF